MQAPAPSQLLGPHPLSGSLPAGRLLQVPAFPGSAHETQAPTQAVLQHTPSTQFALAHWLALLHAAPNLSCGVHVPALQPDPDGQSELEVQWVGQLA